MTQIVKMVFGIAIVFHFLATPTFAATLTVDTTTKLQAIPPNFLGLSTGKTQMCDTMKRAKNSTKFRQMMKNLAPGEIRFGGSGQDDVFWYPNSYTCESMLDGSGNNMWKIGTRTIDDALAVLTDTNWTISYGLNIYKESITNTTTEALYATNAFGSTLLSLTPNNEHDDFTVLSSKWQPYVSAILANNPNAPISGPGNSVIASNFNRTFDSFIDQFHTDLTFSTYHYYSAICTPPDAMGMLLDSQYLDNRLATKVVPAINKSAEYGLPIRMDEGNSHSCGGATGISDAYGSALWGVDFLFTTLKLGVSGVNFNGNFFRDDRISYYSPISLVPGSTNNNELIAQPLYYSMLLFKYAANDGNLIQSVVGGTNKNVRAFAVENNDKTLRVILLNKDPTNVTFNITTSSPYVSASSIRLVGDDLYALVTSPTSTAVRFGGTKVNSNGIWQPSTITPVAVTGTTSQIITPPYTATVVTYIPDTSIKPGDANSDGLVNAEDFRIWRASDVRADFDNNQIVDGKDYTIWQYNFGL